MLDDLMQNPVFLILVLVVAIVYIVINVLLAASSLRARKDKIEEVFNRDKKAIDELHQRVEELKKKDQDRS